MTSPYLLKRDSVIFLGHQLLIDVRNIFVHYFYFMYNIYQSVQTFLCACMCDLCFGVGGGCFYLNTKHLFKAKKFRPRLKVIQDELADLGLGEKVLDF